MGPRPRSNASRNLPRSGRRVRADPTITGDVWACIGFHVTFQTVQQLFAGGWAGDAFVVTNPGTLEMIAFGIVPFALSLVVLELFVDTETDWDEPEVVNGGSIE
ncbi:hypothetical protein [Halostagnicola bangensis]